MALGGPASGSYFPGASTKEVMSGGSLEDTHDGQVEQLSTHDKQRGGHFSPFIGRIKKKKKKEKNMMVLTKIKGACMYLGQNRQ